MGGKRDFIPLSLEIVFVLWNKKCFFDFKTFQIKFGLKIFFWNFFMLKVTSYNKFKVFSSNFSIVKEK